MKFEEEEGAFTDSYRRVRAPDLYMRITGAGEPVKDQFDLLRLVSEVELYYLNLAVVEKKKVLTADHRDRGNVNIMSSVSFPITA